MILKMNCMHVEGKFQEKVKLPATSNSLAAGSEGPSVSELGLAGASLLGGSLAGTSLVGAVVAADVLGTGAGISGAVADVLGASLASRSRTSWF
jgi:hypothetical protein